MQRKKITCIQLDSATPTLVNHVLMPRFGLPLIGTLLRDTGYDVQIFVEYISGGVDWDRILESDAVCFSCFSSAARRTYEMADEIRRRATKKIHLILGGTHASHFDASAADHFDYVVRGEGDDTILQLMDALLIKNERPNGLPGLTFHDNGRIVRNPNAPAVTRLEPYSDYSLIKGYGISRLRMGLKGYNRVVPIQFSRGCQYKCKFCVVKVMFGAGYRVREVETMIRELKEKRKYGRAFMFTDNNFAGNRKATKQLLRRIIEEGLDGRYFCMCRIEITKDDELLALMRRAGVTELFFGFESLNDDTLDAFDKRQKKHDIEQAVEKVNSYGMKIWGSFVIGLDGDGPDIVEKITRFGMKHDFLNLCLFPLICVPKEMPGGELMSERRILIKSWDYKSGNFVEFFPKRMKPSTLQREIIKGYATFYSYRRVLKYILKFSLRHAAHLLAVRLVTHRHLRKIMLEYVEYLKEVEEGLYDQEENLIESRLEGRVIKPIWRIHEGEEAEPVVRHSMST